MKICPRCGKDSAKGALCSECAKEMAFSDKKFKGINIKVCAYCPSYFMKNRWKDFVSLEEVARKAAGRSTGLKPAKIKPLLPKIKLNPGTVNEFEIKVDVSKNEKYFIPAKMEVTVCKKCSKIGTKYYEGVLQLRNPTKEIASYIQKDIEKQRKKGIFVTSKAELKNGIDFYITSRSYLENIGKKLVNEFGGILKVNYKLFTRKNGKDVYRVNVLFESPEFRKGDVVVIDKRPILVAKMGRKVSGIDLATGKKVSFDCKKTKPEKLKVVETTLSKTYPVVEVLHPETYQPVKAENPKNLKKSNNVKVCVLDEKVFLV